MPSTVKSIVQIIPDKTPIKIMLNPQKLGIVSSFLISIHRVEAWAVRSFSKLSVTSPTSQLILQPFRSFTYVTAHSPTLPLLHLRHSSFSNPCFTSPTSQALHLRHLASRPRENRPREISAILLTVVGDV